MNELEALLDTRQPGIPKEEISIPNKTYGIQI